MAAENIVGDLLERLRGRPSNVDYGTLLYRTIISETMGSGHRRLTIRGGTHMCVTVWGQQLGPEVYRQRPITMLLGFISPRGSEFSAVHGTILLKNSSHPEDLAAALFSRPWHYLAEKLEP